MKLTRLIQITTLGVSSVALLWLMLSLGASNSTASPCLTGWADDFDDPTLESRWSWVRENATYWSLTDSPGSLRIVTQFGSFWGDLNNQENLLLTDAPQGDFEITTKVTFTPTQNWQEAMLQVYGDDDNYVLIARAYDYGDKVTFRLEKNSDATTTQEVFSDTTLYLRITKLANVYIGSYSADGIAWTQIGQYTTALVNPKVGLSATNNAPLGSEISADFDFFELEEISQHIFLPVVLKQ